MKCSMFMVGEKLFLVSSATVIDTTNLVSLITHRLFPREDTAFIVENDGQLSGIRSRKLLFSSDLNPLVKKSWNLISKPFKDFQGMKRESCHIV